MDLGIVEPVNTKVSEDSAVLATELEDDNKLISDWDVRDEVAEVELVDDVDDKPSILISGNVCELTGLELYSTVSFWTETFTLSSVIEVNILALEWSDWLPT